MHAVADDDDQRVRGGECRGTDGSDLTPRETVAEFIRRFGPKKGRERG
jgi:hypothetical protein